MPQEHPREGEEARLTRVLIADLGGEEFNDAFHRVPYSAGHWPEYIDHSVTFS
jgi:hypothetical protein